MRRSGFNANDGRGGARKRHQVAAWHEMRHLRCGEAKARRAGVYVRGAPANCCRSSEPKVRAIRRNDVGRLQAERGFLPANKQRSSADALAHREESEARS